MKSHLLEGKSAKRKRLFANDDHVAAVDVRAVKRLLRLRG
jgi:ribosomal protein L35